MEDFIKTAKLLILELKEYKHEYTRSQYSEILKLEKIAKKNKKEFVRKYKKLSGATDWDLPDIIFSES